MDPNELVSRQATFALFDACAIKPVGWVMVRQRVQGEALAYVKDARRGDGVSLSDGLGSGHATYGQGFAGDGRAT
jgi:hypothetical protein